jgi:hypothetical protein
MRSMAPPHARLLPAAHGCLWRRRDSVFWFASRCSTTPPLRFNSRGLSCLPPTWNPSLPPLSPGQPPANFGATAVCRRCTAADALPSPAASTPPYARAAMPSANPSRVVWFTGVAPRPLRLRLLDLTTTTTCSRPWSPSPTTSTTLELVLGLTVPMVWWWCCFARGGCGGVRVRNADAATMLLCWLFHLRRRWDCDVNATLTSTWSAFLQHCEFISSLLYLWQYGCDVLCGNLTTR